MGDDYPSYSQVYCHRWAWLTLYCWIVSLPEELEVLIGQHMAALPKNT